MTSQAPPQTILIVDDQEQNLKIVATVLTMTGYEVTLATSGEQALKRLAARMPDLILLDVIMPDMDGLKVCREIKSNPEWAELPIIFLSAADDKNLVVQALESGGVDYVTKPFNKAELLTRVRTHLALKKAHDDLRSLAEDKDELLGIMTHDLKNHLAGMKLSAALLHERVADMPPKSSQLVENIMQATDRMLVFVREFLANQSAERLQLKAERVDVVRVLQQAVTSHLHMAQAKEITMDLNIPDHPVLANADREGLYQALDNLVSNALKFSPSGSVVTLTAKETETRDVILQVQDQGPGFTKEDRQRVFSRYARLSARPTGGEPSTGLGLSIVKRHIEGMKGSIVIEEGRDVGSSFLIRLPAAKIVNPGDSPAPTANHI